MVWLPVPGLPRPRLGSSRPPCAHRKREERLRKVLQARERVEQMQEEKKKQIEQKFAQFDEKSEKVRALGWRVAKLRSGLYTLGPSVSDLVAPGLGLDLSGSPGFAVLNPSPVCPMGPGVCSEPGGGWTASAVG